jgi:hypothetical protein
MKNTAIRSYLISTFSVAYTVQSKMTTCFKLKIFLNEEHDNDRILQIKLILELFVNG